MASNGCSRIHSSFTGPKKKTTRCLFSRKLGTIFRKLDTGQSEILNNFLEIARLNTLRTQDICLKNLNFALGRQWNLNVFDSYKN